MSKKVETLKRQICQGIEENQGIVSGDTGPPGSEPLGGNVKELSTRALPNAELDRTPPSQ